MLLLHEIFYSATNIPFITKLKTVLRRQRGRLNFSFKGGSSHQYRSSTDGSCTCTYYYCFFESSFMQSDQVRFLCLWPVWCILRLSVTWALISSSSVVSYFAPFHIHMSRHFFHREVFILIPQGYFFIRLTSARQCFRSMEWGSLAGGELNPLAPIIRVIKY